MGSDIAINDAVMGVNVWTKMDKTQIDKRVIFKMTPTHFPLGKMWFFSYHFDIR